MSRNVPSSILEPLQYDFTIYLEQVINSNADSDQRSVLCQHGFAARQCRWGRYRGVDSYFGAGRDQLGYRCSCQSYGGWHLSLCTDDHDTFKIMRRQGYGFFRRNCAIPLPVGLSDFKATRHGVAGITLLEVNTKGFGIERSADGFTSSKSTNGNSNQR